MKTSITNAVVACTIATLAATIAQSKFSGIYQGPVSSHGKFIVAATSGGRLFATASDANGLRDAMDPAKSTVSSKGKINGATPGGTSFTGSISDDFKFTGTGKEKDGTTFRLTGSRTYK